MPFPPKKLKAFVDQESKKGKGKQFPPEDDDAGNPGVDKGDEGDEGGERHLSPEETQKMLTKAENEAENGPDAALVDALVGYDGSAGEPPEGFEKDLWEAAAEIVGPDDYQGTVDPWLVVAHLYKRMGGKVPGGAPSDEDAAAPDEE